MSTTAILALTTVASVLYGYIGTIVLRRLRNASVRQVAPIVLGMFAVFAGSIAATTLHYEALLVSATFGTILGAVANVVQFALGAYDTKPPHND